MDVQKLRDSLFNFACVSYSRSGGPGGQNVNKENTKVTLRLKIDRLKGLTELESRHIKSRLASRISMDGELIVQSSGERLQSVNEKAAFRRLEAAIVSAARIPKKRRPTRPTKASKENRLKTKKITGLKKNDRRAIYDE
jgi:ribosome-associated protein